MGREAKRGILVESCACVGKSETAMVQKNKTLSKARPAKGAADPKKSARPVAAAKPVRARVEAVAPVKKPVASASPAPAKKPQAVPVKGPAKAIETKKPVAGLKKPGTVAPPKAAAAPKAAVQSASSQPGKIGAAKPVAAAVKPVVGKPIAGPAKPVAATFKSAGAGSKPGALKPGTLKPGLVPTAQRPISVSQPAGVRTVPAAMPKAAGPRLTAPVAAPPASPKAIAEKAAQARNELSKRPVSQRHGFKTNEFIVYPAHGVGRIIGIEEQEIAGMALELFVINFDKEKLTLRVPTGKLASVGMRKLADDGIVKKAMETLKGRARIKRTMWSRRAQEYVAKINSGDLVSIAEVVRDLYRSDAQPEQSYSERQLYEDALDRMAREIAAVEKLDERGAVQRITEVLSKSAKGRRIAESEADGETEEVKAA